MPTAELLNVEGSDEEDEGTVSDASVFTDMSEIMDFETPSGRIPKQFTFPEILRKNSNSENFSPTRVTIR
jgi:hypothetical protein